MIKIKLRVRKSDGRKDFFDSEAVIRALDRAKYKVLVAYGARVRRTAQQSMRTVKKKRPPSPAGNPPNAFRGFIKKGKFGVSFRYDKQQESVVVGPEPFYPSNSDQVVGTHEHGGTLRVGRGGRIRARYPARPFMAPANEKRLPELAQLWKDSIVR